MSLITIDQLLESVDLDFEPRFVTKDAGGIISVWGSKPKQYIRQKYWASSHFNVNMESFVSLKLAEFDGKDWTECIYEVPRKEEPKDKIKIGTLYIDKGVTFGDGDDDDVGFVEDEVPRKTTGKIEKIEVGYNNSLKAQDWQDIAHTVANKINELVDAVNELKAKFTLPALKPDLTDEDLRKMMCDPKYWRDGDSATIQKVQNGFNKLYGNKN